MKFWNQAWLCLAVFDFEAHIMLNFSRYRITGMGKKLKCSCELSVNLFLVISLDL